MQKLFDEETHSALQQLMDETIEALQLAKVSPDVDDLGATFAVALLKKPDLLVLDEPTVGLDPVLRRDLWALFHRLADDGRAVFVSSHVMDEADRCDRLLLMRDGRIIADGTPQEIRQKTGADDIESAFLAIVEAAA